MTNTFTINLNKFPGLARLQEKDPQELEKVLNAAFKKEENEIIYGLMKQRETQSKEIFGMTVQDVQKLFTDVFFDHKLIIEKHHDQKEKNLMTMLGRDNHPLSVFLGKSQAYTATGERIERSKFTSYDDVKDFFQEYLYALRYCSMKDLADFLMLGEFDLVENLKMHNVKELLEIQPSLAYQKKHNIPVGKRIPGSAFFDCGSHDLIENNICPVCKYKDSLYKVLDTVLCQSCKAGFKTE